MATKTHKSAQYKARHSASPDTPDAAVAPEGPEVLDEAQVLDALRDVGAVTRGHFVLSSGRHSNVYAEKFRALEHPDLAMSLGASIAARLAGEQVDVVCSPALGAIVLGFSAAYALGCRFVIAERVGEDAMALRRGFAIAPGERALVVEDVVTTGRSVKEVLALIAPGALVGVACMLDRSAAGASVALGVRTFSLARLEAPTWDPADCPLCTAGDQPKAPGSRYLSA